MVVDRHEGRGLQVHRHRRLLAGARDANGNIVPDAKRFPSGMKALADYVHGKGLKFGIYSDAGTETCQGRPGSRGYESQDARAVRRLGRRLPEVRLVQQPHGRIDAGVPMPLMSDALQKSGRPIVFSLCEWGSNKPWLWAKDVGNLWRTTGDIIDKWEGTEKWGGLGMIQILDLQDGLESYAGPGTGTTPTCSRWATAA